MSATDERWAPVLGYEGVYEVSDHGSVRSLDRMVSRLRGKPVLKKGQPIKLHLAGKGYLYVGLKHEGQRLQIGVHRLVAHAFCRPGSGHDVNHIDFNKTNNLAGNLEWVTRKENMAHAKAAGRYELQHSGGKTLARNNPRCAVKLTPAQADEVKRLAAEGKMRQKDIGAMFGIGQAMVSCIHRGESWRSEWRGRARPGVTKHRSAGAMAELYAGVEA